MPYFTDKEVDMYQGAVSGYIEPKTDADYTPSLLSSRECWIGGRV